MANSEPTGNRVNQITIGTFVGCIAIVGATFFFTRPKIKDDYNARISSCLGSMKNLNSALVMYRADYDGYSPAFEQAEKRVAMEKLKSYVPGKLIGCPAPATSPTANYPYQWRMMQKGSSPVLYTYATQPDAVVAVCGHHLKTTQKVLWRGIIPRLGTIQNFSDPGLDNVLLRDGSAKSVRANGQRHMWKYDKGVFTPINVMTSSMKLPMAEKFVWETGSPEFER